MRIACGLVLSLAGACTIVDAPTTASTEQAGMNMQGMNMQGMNMQGMNMQGMNMQGFRLDGVTLAGSSLSNVRVERGEVVAERGGVTLRGTALVGAHFQAQVRNTSVDPPVAALVEFRITAIAAENPAYDPTRTGSTYLYTLEQLVDGTAWQPACPVDTDGRRVAIPVASTFDEHGDRIASSTMFTFGCTTGVIAKCYRWGYRPWVTGYGNLDDMHWTCTRAARADYCGNGVPHTRDGTWINVWDTLPAPGPIQRHGLLTPIGMVFEAGWNTHGAVCLSRSRWLLDDLLGLDVAALCPDRLVPPGLGETVCDTVGEVLGYDANAKLFDEAYINLL
jgi:hypothetical protein